MKTCDIMICNCLQLHFIAASQWSVTIVSPAKTVETIEMPFGGGLGWAQETVY